MDIRNFFKTSPITIDLDEYSWIIKGQFQKNKFPNNFDVLWALHPEEYGQVQIYGKLIDTPRWQ